MSHDPSADESALSRRSLFAATLGAAAFGMSAAAVGTTGSAADGVGGASGASIVGKESKRYAMKKSINLWAFPYPQKMTLEQCLRLAKEAGFDGIELNYDLDNDLSPKSNTARYTEIRKLCDSLGLAVSGLCSFLFWPYPLTAEDPAKRTRAAELASLMTQCAHDLGTDNLLVVPGAVTIPWRDDYPPITPKVCDRRAREAIGKLLPQAEKLGVSLNIENIFFNGYLMTPSEMITFVDSFSSEQVKVHFDTGNIMLYQYPEHWIEMLGPRIKNVHLKEFTTKGTDHSLESFRPLLDGTTNWPAVLEAFAATNYKSYLTFEYFHPYQHWPEALVHQTSDSLDRMLGRK
ncbi:MAG: sugar phosphate isomerase/epimerase [Planctomycetia bacterium]|nr:sugar phosphate isomerase/epimerase [Planctomycetia bacterium]